MISSRLKLHLSQNPQLKRAALLLQEWAGRWTIRKTIRGRNNQLRYAGSRLTKVKFDIVGNDNTLEIHEGCYLNQVTFYIRGDRHRIVIGPGVRFNRGSNIWFEDSDGSLTIGERSTFEDVHLAVTEPQSSISIGQDCMFAYDIEVRTGDSHSVLSRDTGERLNPARNVSIDDHVWVAAHSYLLKGTMLATDSIVATGSIVTRAFSEVGVVVAGNPAQIIKRGVTWSRERVRS